MSRFVIITLLAIVATTSARPQIVSYEPRYYGGYYDYPYYSYPYTPVTYVETIPVATVVDGPVPVVPAKLIAKTAARQEAAPAPPPAPAAPPAPAPPAPAPAPAAPAAAPALVTITKTIPNPAALLEALPLQQLLELPPVKALVGLKTSKLQAIMGLKSALQEKLAPIAALLP